MKRMLLLTPLFLAGCHVIHHRYDGNSLITPGTVLPRESQPIGRIAGSRKAFFLFFGLIPLSSSSASGPNIAEYEANQNMKDWNGITHLQIQEEFGPLDLLVNFLTLNLFTMMSVDVRGEVHRYSRIS